MTMDPVPVSHGSGSSLYSVHHFPEANYSFHFIPADSDFKRDFEFLRTLSCLIWRRVSTGCGTHP